jgi:hypothetical protein
MEAKNIKLYFNFILVKFTIGIEYYIITIQLLLQLRNFVLNLPEMFIINTWDI